MTKQIENYTLTAAKFADIQTDDRFIAAGYTYLGWGGVNRCPELTDDIWVDFDNKVWQVMHWSEKKAA